MPFVVTKTNATITADQERVLKAAFGKAIALVPGKSEDYLLLSFEDSCRLWLRGRNDEKTAYITASIFGNEDHAGFDRFAAAVTDALVKTLGIPAQNVYIKFDDISVWGAGGMCFDRNLF